MKLEVSEEVDLVFNDLERMKLYSCDHGELVNALMRASRQGYDVSEDGSMIVAKFDNAYILILPWGRLKLLYENK